MGFPGHPVVKILCFQFRGHGFNLWLGKVAHVAWCSQKVRENKRLISVIKTDAKIITNKILNQIQQNIKKIMCYDQVGFIPGIQVWFNIFKKSI